MLTALRQYIPLQNGQDLFLKEQNLINNLGGLIGYTPRDGMVVFTEDITNVNGENVNAVDIQLVVADLDKYSDYDLLPLPADMAGQIVAEVVSLLMPTPQNDLKVDSLSEEAPNKR